MGCGKSKHAVETATTVVKSSDGTKQTTTTTKTVTETGDSSLIQKQVESKSFFVEDANKTTITTNVDPNGVAKTEDPTLGENVQDSKEDVNVVKDSNTTDDVILVASTENVAKDEDDKNDKVVPTSNKDDLGTTKIVKEDEVERESALKAHNNVKASNIIPTTEEEKVKLGLSLTKDNKTKNEFMTPTLSEDVVGPFEVGKGKEENKTAALSDVKTNNASSNPKDDNLKVEESKRVEAAIEDVEVTDVDIAKVKISSTIETEKVPTASKVNVSEAQEKKA